MVRHVLVCIKQKRHLKILYMSHRHAIVIQEDHVLFTSFAVSQILTSLVCVQASLRRFAGDAG